MKVAILHYSVPPIVGGVESVIAHHARLMSADGHTVRLIAARGFVHLCTLAPQEALGNCAAWNFPHALRDLSRHDPVTAKNRHAGPQ